MQHNPETESILAERFGKDSVMALATLSDGLPSVRSVDAVYLGGAFYVVTDARSNKIREIGLCPSVALAGDWFTCRGKGRSLGSFGSPENKELANALRSLLTWLDNGHSDLSDPDTVILKIEPSAGVLFSHGTRFDIDF